MCQALPELWEFRRSGRCLPGLWAGNTRSFPGSGCDAVSGLDGAKRPVRPALGPLSNWRPEIYPASWAITGDFRLTQRRWVPP